MMALAQATSARRWRSRARPWRCARRARRRRGTDAYFLAICLFFTGHARRGGDAPAPLPRDARRPASRTCAACSRWALLAQAHAERELDAAERLIAESLATGSARGLDEHPPTQQAHLAAGIVALAAATPARRDAFEHAATLARRGGDRVEIATRCSGSAAPGPRPATSTAPPTRCTPPTRGSRARACRRSSRRARRSWPRSARRGRPRRTARTPSRARSTRCSCCCRRPALRGSPSGSAAARPRARRRPADPAPPRRGDARRGGHPGPPARAALSALTAAGGAVRAASTARGARAGARPDRAARRTRAARATAAS